MNFDSILYDVSINFDGGLSENHRLISILKVYPKRE